METLPEGSIRTRTARGANCCEATTHRHPEAAHSPTGARGFDPPPGKEPDTQPTGHGLGEASGSTRKKLKPLRNLRNLRRGGGGLGGVGEGGARSAPNQGSGHSPRAQDR